MEYGAWVEAVVGQERWRGYSLTGCEQLVRGANGQDESHVVQKGPGGGGEILLRTTERQFGFGIKPMA